MNTKSSITIDKPHEASWSNDDPKAVGDPEEDGSVNSGFEFKSPHVIAGFANPSKLAGKSTSSSNIRSIDIVCEQELLFPDSSTAVKVLVNSDIT